MIDNSYIKLEDEKVLLGVIIDSNLTFENSICKKTSQNFNAFGKIHMNILQKRRKIMESL